MNVVILDDWEYSFSNHPKLEQLKEHFDVTVYHDQPSQSELLDRLSRADIVLPIRERTKFTKEILQKISHIKLLAQTGSGVAHIDMPEANKLNIPVATTPGGVSGVVELTFGFMIAFSRQLIPLDHQMKQGHWPHAIGSSLEGKTLGIIGLGKIGSRVAQLGQALGMNVVAWGPRLTGERAQEQGVTYVSFDQLLRDSHFITLHVRLVEKTTGLIGHEHFNQMRADAVVINTSRGRVIDEKALVHALQHKKIAGAGLDVFGEEPIHPEHPLLKLENVILSPHIGWKTDQMFQLFLDEATENIISYVIKKQPRRVVNLDYIDIE